ncbi:MAG: choice-of-anchor J domain-containing protein, partial [Anaerolinea sp.]|nr:choice-of-anchor J domain-containing protein [Anaerolinea sp.]
GYPQSWTQYTVTLSGLPANASGRLAFRYFVTDGGPSGNNSNYIGIDTVEFTSAGGGGACSAPADVPWLSLAPTSGATAGGGSTPVTVTFNSTGLAVGVYNANLCVDSNDPDAGPGNGTDLVVVPVTLTVEESQPGVFACNMPAEGFDGGVPPAGWAVQSNEPDGPQWTTIALSGETGNYTNGTGEAASVSSDAFGAAEMDTSLVTPAFDLTGFGTASLNYTANYQNFANYDYLDVDISTDGGATWANLLSWNEDHGTFGAPPGVDVNLDLSAYAGQSGLMLRYRYYDPNSGDWNWYAQVDNVGLSCGQVAEQPNIDVSPLSMSSTQPPNATTQQQLNVGNTGTANLTWMIDEEPARPTAAPAPSVVSIDKLGAPAAVQRSAKELQDLLNSPTADVVQDGSFEAGTPSPFWTEASTNFGTPLCDVPGCGTGTGTGPLTGAWWAWFGGIAAYEAGSVSQSVTIPSGGPATLSFWVEQFVCSGDAADYLEVNMDGTQLWATTAADPACGTLGYRQVTLDVSAYANGGAHTLEFSSEVFGSDTTNFFVDDVMLDAQSGPVVCAAPSNVPWLSVNPTNGTTAPAASTPVQVTFDSTGLAVGVYNANLCIDSNDPDAGPGNGTELVIVPVELIVEGAASITVAKTVGTVPGVCAATSTIEVLPGTTVYYCYTVTNTGDVTLYSHTLVDDQLGTLFTNLAYALAPGASVDTVTLGQSFPAVITMPTTNVGTWTAAQSSTGGLSATASGTAFVDVIYFGCRNPEEDFENGVPTWGWSVVNNAGGASWGNIAACGPNGDGGNFTGGLGDAACMSPSSLTAGAYDSELRTPVFSLVGYSEA